ncbi:unnamed protein product [Aspergillus oryzae]|uniref:Unnamed protein product n=2 Tax=Aspergillus oryzae TaxID=5062 RepID=A0AAN4Z2V8_ASPOZ|nr:unnamed protein product [Aspergillus oryzae]GMF96604.1 unnamed protein product [Aspergillus oryzae]GMG16406.1 unnamed protein product [Aspergillus oryzae]GMG38981.1 unnamed protein product [Aspergillus oryzae]GMG41502.1 unnamed protein product [Aspergillus oryzae var. brunneus]
MTVEVVPLTEADIPEAIEVIQQAFAEDPYFQWVFDPSKVSSDQRTKPPFPESQNSSPAITTQGKQSHHRNNS